MTTTRADLHLELRHDLALVLKKSLKEETLTCIMNDLRNLKFNCDLRQEGEDWVLLIGLNDETEMLKAAEHQN